MEEVVSSNLTRSTKHPTIRNNRLTAQSRNRTCKPPPAKKVGSGERNLITGPNGNQLLGSQAKLNGAKLSQPSDRASHLSSSRPSSRRQSEQPATARVKARTTPFSGVAP